MVFELPSFLLQGSNIGTNALRGSSDCSVFACTNYTGPPGCPTDEECTQDGGECTTFGHCEDTDCPNYQCPDSPTPSPTFTAYFLVQSSTSASFSASFQHGDSSYVRHRFVRVFLNGEMINDFDSDEVGGSSSTFSGTITGLTPQTLYYWTIQLGYYGGPSDYQDPQLTSYVDQDMFTTYDEVVANLIVSPFSDSLSVPWSFTASVNTYWSLQIDGVEIYTGSGDRQKSGVYTFTTYGSHTFDLYVWNYSEYDVDSAFVIIEKPGAQPYIYTTKNGTTKWWPATAYVYSNGWKEATASIYDNGWNP